MVNLTGLNLNNTQPKKANKQAFNGKQPLQLAKFNQSNDVVSFGRALTSEEKVDYKKTIKEAVDKLGIKNFASIIPATAFPSNAEYNTGIGSSCSESAKNFLQFLKDIAGVNTVQLLPEGSINPGNKSPYSGPVFALGSYLVDPQALSESGLLSKEEMKDVLIGSGTSKDFRVQYDNYFKNYDNLIGKAYENFCQLPEDSELKQKFNAFKTDAKIEPWLRKQAVFEAIVKKYNNDPRPHTWISKEDEAKVKTNLEKAYNSDKASEKDLAVRYVHKNMTNLLNGSEKEKAIAEKELSSLVKSSGKEINSFEFTQFMAFSQKKEMKEFANKEGINLVGDCHVGFTEFERWLTPKAFLPHTTSLGCDGGKWGFPAMDYWNTKEAEKLLEQKFDLCFENHNGSRIDAAWEYVQPFMYHETENGEIKKYENPKDKNVFVDVIAKSQKKNNIDPQFMIAELLADHPIDEVISIFKSRGFSDIGLNRYGREVRDIPKDTWATPGTHDNSSLVDLANYNPENVKGILGNLFMGPRNEYNGSKHVQLTVFDIFGMSERYNDFNNCQSDQNWSMRIPTNYEEFYYKQLAGANNGNKAGLNLADTLLNSLNWKHLSDVDDLKAKLANFANILKDSKGPMTTKDADKIVEKKKLNLQ